MNEVVVVTQLRTFMFNAHALRDAMHVQRFVSFGVNDYARGRTIGQGEIDVSSCAKDRVCYQIHPIYVINVIFFSTNLFSL